MVSLCLSMIVKNEEKTIERMLRSVVTIIDSYCICDTGSTDNTKEVIQRFFDEQEITGIVCEEPFQNFEYNRNFALHKALELNPTHILVMDADMVLEIRQDDFDMKKNLEEHDIFFIFQGSSHFYYKNVRIFKVNPEIRYIGLTHEYLSHPSSCSIKNFDFKELFIVDYGDGGCKQNKYERDIMLLSQDLEKNPKNVRSWFYLANTFRDSGQKEKAIECYEKRIELGGWEEEVWSSMYQKGLLNIELGNEEKGVYDLLAAYQIDPGRVENLFHIVRFYRNKGKHRLCGLFYDLLKNQKKESRPDALFVENDVNLYKLDYEYSIFAFYLGVKDIFLQALQILEYCSDENILQNLLSNLRFYNHHLTPQINKVLTKRMYKTWRDMHFIDCSSSSASIIDYDDNLFLLNFRIVNYFVDEKGIYHSQYNRIVTWNEAVFIKKTTLEVTESRALEDQHLESQDKRISGLEDLRIFRSTVDNQIHYLATEWSENKTFISRGHYNVQEAKIEKPSRLIYKEAMDVEKNWVHIPVDGKNCVVYKWHPLTILEINEENNVSLYKEVQSPHVLRTARGSSNGYLWNNEIWFVVHYVAYGEPRYYYHLIVVLDKDTFACKRFTSLLKLNKHFPIEYCLGIVVNEKNVLLTLSEMDRTTNLNVYDKTALEQQMFTPEQIKR